MPFRFPNESVLWYLSKKRRLKNRLNNINTDYLTNYLFFTTFIVKIQQIITGNILNYVGIHVMSLPMHSPLGNHGSFKIEIDAPDPIL